ncbi:MAG: hypothetical protein J0L75_20935 [Spirochaetes bacterium]|nr:hypothetical protein [Spirochaetota bacterium]
MSNEFDKMRNFLKGMHENLDALDKLNTAEHELNKEREKQEQRLEDQRMSLERLKWKIDLEKELDRRRNAKEVAETELIARTERTELSLLRLEKHYFDKTITLKDEERELQTSVQRSRNIKKELLRFQGIKRAIMQGIQQLSIGKIEEAEQFVSMLEAMREHDLEP